MPSFINYRFKSSKEFSQIFFESNDLPLWELKYEIINQRKMASKDFDLLFYDSETDEQILDEYTHIPRNSYIIVQRIPLWMSKNNIPARERKNAEQVPLKRFIKEPPENYVCFRCGNKGHFIQHCPTNNDKNFDIVKVRKPSGIPKDFLEKVNGEIEGSGAVLVTEDGFVKARPQVQDWTRHGRTIAAQGKVPQDLRCPRCYGLFSRPVVTNCGHAYCEDCARPDTRCAICSRWITDACYDKKIDEQVSAFLGK